LALADHIALNARTTQVSLVIRIRKRQLLTLVLDSDVPPELRDNVINREWPRTHLAVLALVSCGPFYPLASLLAERHPLSASCVR